MLPFEDVVSLSCANKYFRREVVRLFLERKCPVCQFWHPPRQAEFPLHPGTWAGHVRWTDVQIATSRFYLHRAKEVASKNRKAIVLGIAGVVGAAVFIAGAPLIAGAAVAEFGFGFGQGFLKSHVYTPSVWSCCGGIFEAPPCTTCDGVSFRSSGCVSQEEQSQ